MREPVGAIANGAGTDVTHQFDDALNFPAHATAALKDCKDCKDYKDDMGPDNDWSDTHMAFKVTS